MAQTVLSYYVYPFLNIVIIRVKFQSVDCLLDSASLTVKQSTIGEYEKRSEVESEHLSGKVNGSNTSLWSPLRLFKRALESRKLVQSYALEGADDFGMK